MADINQVIISGTTQGKPALSYTPKGLAICTVSVQCVREYTAKGQLQRDTQVIPCTAYQAQAEQYAREIPAGAQVIISGRVVCRQYADKSGTERCNVSIAISGVQVFSAAQSAQVAQSPAAQTVPVVHELQSEIPF